MSTHTINKLIEIVKKEGFYNKSACKELYNLYFSFVYNYSFTILKNKEDSLDVAQETFLEVFKSINSLRDNNSFKFWVKKIVISKASRVIKKNKQIVYSDDLPEVDYTYSSYDKYDPERLFYSKLIRSEIDKELDKLSEEKKNTFKLFYYNDLSLSEISKILGCPEGTIKSRLHSIRKTILKNKLINSYNT